MECAFLIREGPSGARLSSLKHGFLIRGPQMLIPRASHCLYSVILNLIIPSYMTCSLHKGQIVKGQRFSEDRHTCHVVPQRGGA